MTNYLLCGVKKGVNKGVKKGYNMVMKKEAIDRIRAIHTKLNNLPKGYISTKTINGHVYHYHQWSENGKKYSKYLSEKEWFTLNELIIQRQKLEQELVLLKKGYKSDDSLYCTLMHLDEKVVDLTILLETGLIINVGELYSKYHLPVGIGDNLNGLLEWWNDRSIPLTRSGIQDALEILNVNNPKILLLKCYGLSLSDQYWIKPKDDDIEWYDINFFENNFSEDVGKILLGGEKKKKKLNLSSPDNTTVGNLKKRWKIIDGKRVMIKGGSNPYRQEPFNEVISSVVADILGLNSVKYTLLFDDEYPYSVCEDFVNKEEDFVTAYQIGKVLKKNNSDNAYTHFVKCANHLGIKNIEDYLDKLIVFDFIIANEDRHFNNLGFIRNAKTLEFVGPSPIFDSGAAFGFDKLTSDIKPFKDIISKPFQSNPLEQLKLVKSFKWLDINALNKVKESLLPLFKQFESKYLDNERITSIVDSTKARIDYLIEHYLYLHL